MDELKVEKDPGGRHSYGRTDTHTGVQMKGRIAELFISKMPELDLTWTDQQKLQWFDSFERLAAFVKDKEREVEIDDALQNVSRKQLKLESGCVLTVSIAGNVAELTPLDREIVFGIADLMRTPEAKNV